MTIMESVKSLFPNAVMCRTESAGNFLAVPDAVIDGVQTYKAVKVSSLLFKATKANPAFDVESASKAYAEFEAKQAEKASKPKKSKEPDPAKVEAKAKRQAGLLEYMKGNAGVEMTSQEIFLAIPDVYDGCLIMAVGSDLQALAKVDENLTVRVEKGKKYWTYVA